MTRFFSLILAATAFPGSGFAWEETVEPLPPEAQLQWFLGDETQYTSILPLVEQLDSPEFNERETASSQLSELPTLPPFLRTLANDDERPEVRFRLREVNKLYPLKKETENLNAVLDQIADPGTKGTLKAIISILELNIWKPSPESLQNAVRSTVTPADLPLLEHASHSDSVIMRRLAAAGYSSLPADQSTLPLRELSLDDAPSVALLAASELALRNDPSCLAAYAGLLDASDFHARHRSWSALKGLSGQAFGYDPAADQATRKAPARRWLDWSHSQDAAITGKLPESTMIALFNGRDLTGWEIFEKGRPAPESQSWIVRDEHLVSDGKGLGDIRTTDRFDNYVLSLDYKTHDKRGDGGIGIMLTKENELLNGKLRPTGGSYLEVQLLPGRAGDIYVIGQFQARANGKKISFSNPRSVNVEDPIGEWNALKITVRDGTAEVSLNGTVVNRITDGKKEPGKIVLRDEGHKISYRNLVILPIPSGDE